MGKMEQWVQGVGLGHLSKVERWVLGPPNGPFLAFFYAPEGTQALEGKQSSPLSSRQWQLSP